MALSVSLALRQGLRTSSVSYLRATSSSVVSNMRSLHDHQASLPRLPVPPLEDTLNKYLKTVKPVVTEEEYKMTEEIVTRFGASGGVGQKLQNILEKRAANTDNWLSEWWLNTAYLDFRWPVVVWSSPGLVFPLQEFKNLDDQLNYAAKLIAGALDYKIMVDEETVPIDRSGKDLLDMSQYFKIFGTCRIPGVTRDFLSYFCQEPNPPKHVIVVHNNHFFKIDVYGKKGKPLNVKQLYSQLRDTVERSTFPAKPVGLLTTQNRNVWGKACKQLSRDRNNKASIKEIQRGIFVVCLDGPVINPSGNRMNDAALQCIHGNGSKGYAGNRWYDKTIQFVIGNKGVVGLTYEHSPAEGPPIANLMDHIVNYMSLPKKDNQLPAVEMSRPQRLQLTTTADIDDEIEKAKAAVDSLVDDLEMTCFEFKGFGKEFIKSQKLSPDSFIQMAVQLTFFRIHNEPGAHYESASTRKYLYGRTETIRSCSLASVEFSKSMLNEEETPQQKVAALKNAIESHKNYARDAVSGFGVDRHLLGLKLAAIEVGMDVPTLFMDVGYMRSSHMRLSTSQVPARCEAFMCYGPLVPDGYGCCYNPRANSIFFGTSAFNSSPETDSATFRAALEQSLMDMHDVLMLDGGLKSKL